MILCTCEKPSVAKDIAKVLGARNYRKGYYEGNGYLVTWAVGHLIGLYYPEDYSEDYKKWDMDLLPILPQPFRYKVMPGTKDQFYVIKNLIQRNDIEYIVNCGDAGREGEYIQRLIYQAAQNKHPIKRLWLSSFTEKEIQKGFNNLLEHQEKDNLYYEAKSRSEADWLVGINLSRLFSIRHNTPLSIGRVQTPTLRLIVDLDQKIQQFQPEPFYEVIASFQNGFQAKWFHEKESRFAKREDAQRIVEKCNGKTGIVSNMETKPVRVERPLLYSLDTLQKDANKLYGYGAAEVLSIAQSLYETHKITTYPRTDSNYLSTEMQYELPELIRGIGSFAPFQKTVTWLQEKGLKIDGRVINNAKISDHHAIIVTEKIHGFDFSKLKEKERHILNLILVRMLCAVSDAFIYDETKLIAMVEGESFASKTKRVTQLGFRMIESELLKKSLPNDMKEFEVAKGESVVVESMDVVDKKTTPPKPFTEGTLIDAMQNVKRYIQDQALKDAVKERGLGTVATRASIIERLKMAGYIVEEGRGKQKYLHATEKGKLLISKVPNEISSPELTADWEYKLSRIESGALDPQAFLQEICAFVSENIKKYHGIDTSSGFSATSKSQKEVIGICPFCGSPVYENKKAYYCSDYKNCNFTFWKSNKYFDVIGFKLTKTHAKNLLKDRKTYAKNLKSKKGTTYDAWITVEWATPYPKFSMNFD